MHVVVGNSCHCEERSDEAISSLKIRNYEIASSPDFAGVTRNDTATTICK